MKKIALIIALVLGITVLGKNMNIGMVLEFLKDRVW